MRNVTTRRIFLASAYLFLGLALLPTLALADSSRYPQYAQQQPSVEPDFIPLDRFLDEIRAGKKPLIVDVRTNEEYQETHILGSVSIPLDQVPKRLAEIPQDRPVILY